MNTMASTTLRAGISAFVAAALLAGCATRGQLRRGMEEQRAALEAERQEREAADTRFEGELGTLRGDLEGLRTEFGARIDTLAAGMSFALPIQFGFNQAEVQQGDIAALDRFARVVQRHYPTSMITVAGFADPAGSVRYNQALSQQRAEAVRSYLLTQGLPQSQLRAVGHGEAQPVVPGAAGSEPGAEMNRRVVFIVETRDMPMAGAPGM